MIPITCNQCGYTRQVPEIARLYLGDLKGGFKTPEPKIKLDPGCPNCAMKDTEESF